jgi:hypothetical protein
MIQGKGVSLHAYEAWEKWVDNQHSGKHQTQYLSMWYSESPTTHQWKGLTQQAFFDAYEAGFTDRVFEGGNE